MLPIIFITFLYLLCFMQYEIEGKTFKSKKKTSSKIKKVSKSTNNKQIMYYCQNDNIEARIMRNLKDIEEETCLKFKKQKSPLKSNGINFYKSNNDKDVVYNTKMKLKNVSLTTNTYHDRRMLKFFIGYALGLIPEVARRDRDRDVVIYDNNIKTPYTKYFTKVKNVSKSYYKTDFDFSSIMLFSPSFGSKGEGMHTYSSKRISIQERMLGRFSDYSFNDYRRINILHCKDKCKKKCKNGGYYINDCNKCECPTFFGGKQCEKYAPEFGGCGLKKEYTAYSKKKFQTFKGISGECFYRIKSSNSKKKVRLTIENFKGVNGAFVLTIKYRNDKGALGEEIYNNVKNLTFPALSNNVLISFITYHTNNELKISYQRVN